MQSTLNGTSKRTQELPTVLLVAFLLILIGHTLIRRQELNGPTNELTIRADALVYFAMANGHQEQAPRPFAYRILVPLLASSLPFSTPTAFLLISYASLFICYVIIQLVGRRLGFTFIESLAGLLIVLTTTWHLHNYHNPYLPDAFGLLAITLMFYAAVMNAFPLFVLSSLIGILGREGTLFFVPVWLATKQYRKAIVSICLASIFFTVPRLLIAVPHDRSGSFASYILRYAQVTLPDMIHRPQIIIARIILSWHYVWLMAIAGLLLFRPHPRAWIVQSAFVLLLLGALVSLIGATDIGRMFAILLPIMAIGCAQFYKQVVEKKPQLGYIFFALCLLQLFMSMPTWLTQRTSWVFAAPWPRLMLYTCGLAFSLYGVMINRSQLSIIQTPERRQG